MVIADSSITGGRCINEENLWTNVLVGLTISMKFVVSIVLMVINAFITRTATTGMMIIPGIKR